jgi:hypothetical protein
MDEVFNEVHYIQAQRIFNVLLNQFYHICWHLLLLTYLLEDIWWFWLAIF